MENSVVKQHQPEISEEAFLDASLEWRHVLGEAWGTFLLVLVAVGGPVATARTDAGISQAANAVAPGLMVMVAIYSLGAVSGAHLNPAVSFAKNDHRPSGKEAGKSRTDERIALAFIVVLYL